MYLNSHRNYFK